ncbi:Trafficking protein particle complex subunit 5 [Balamuthia mandrillaris]
MNIVNRPVLNIVDRPVTKGKKEVSLSAFAYLFSEFVQFSQDKVNDVTKLETRLSNAGYHVGIRALELISFREKNYKRDVELLRILAFISYTMWKVLFGQQALLERSTDNDDEYMIRPEGDSILNKYISVPKDFGGLNCAAFAAGVVKGALDGAEFPAKVTAHYVPSKKDAAQLETVILIKFDKAVLEREKKRSSSS